MMLSASPSGLAGGDGGALADGDDMVRYSDEFDVVTFHFLSVWAPFFRWCSFR